MRAPLPLYLRFPGALVLLFLAALASSCSPWRSMGATPSGERLTRMQESPQYHSAENVFVNELPHGGSDIAGSAYAALTNDAPTVPTSALPRDDSLADRLQLPAGEDLSVSWVGHSTVLIELDGRRFLTDPIFSERASPFDWVGPERFGPPALAIAELPPLDGVLISHDHYDHLDMESIVALNRPGMRFFVPLGVGAHLELWGVAASQIEEMDWWDEREFLGVRIACVPSRHFSGRGLLNRNGTLWAGWVLQGAKESVYFSGDTSMGPHFWEIGQRYGPFDIAMLEVAAYNQRWVDSHLGPEQAAQAFRLAQGRLMVPIHWGTFSLALHGWTEPVERLQRAAAADSIHLVIPRVGETVRSDSPRTVAPWWPPVAWQGPLEVPIVSTNLPVMIPPPPLQPRSVAVP